MKAIAKYLLLTFAITYACWWGVAALVAFTDLVYGDLLPSVLYLIGNFGPAIAALCCMGGRPFLRTLKNFLFSYQRGGVWVFLLFAALVTATVGLSSMEWNPQMTALNFSSICWAPPSFTEAKRNWAGGGSCSPPCRRRSLFRSRRWCAAGYGRCGICRSGSSRGIPISPCPFGSRRRWGSFSASGWGACMSGQGARRACSFTAL